MNHFDIEITELVELNHGLTLFEQQILSFIDKLGLSLHEYSADHISVRCYQHATAERWKQGLLQCATLFSEKMINGRTICLFKLNNPIKIGDWYIECVELPYPGKKLYPHEGWEHIEFVVPCEVTQFHATALSLFPDSALLEPKIKLKFSQPEGEGEGLANPTLAVTDGNVTIKFHPYSIQQIVASED